MFVHVLCTVQPCVLTVVGATVESRPSAGQLTQLLVSYDTIRYDTRCYFNVRSKANMSQLNLPHGTDN